MASNGATTPEDAEMSTCEGDSVVTMMDVLKEQQDFEDDANAVLGASDDKNCTYSKGYVKRQAIYACLTCCPEAKVDPSKRAGVCLACSLNCHENHELVELYTKRNFRCDCGNPKFSSHPCQFTPDKNDLNYENKYNQNFSGIYCVCHRPYPDPEAVEEEEMLQCIVCEDWLHTKHLEATVPHNDLYEEMICKDCMEEYDFLHDYSELVVNVVDKEVVVDEFDFDFELKKSSRKSKSKKTVANGNVDVKSNQLHEKSESLLTNGEKKSEETAPKNVDDKVNEINSDNLTSNENNESKMEISSSELENKDNDKTDLSEVSAEKLTNIESNDSKCDTSSTEVENKDVDKTQQSDAEKPADDLNPVEIMNSEAQIEDKKFESTSKVTLDENKNDSTETKENIEETEKMEAESTEKSGAIENANEQDKSETTEKNCENQEKIEEERLLQDDVETPVTEKNSEKAELPDTSKNEDQNVDSVPTETKNSDLVPNEIKSIDSMETDNNDTPVKKDNDTAEMNHTSKTDETNPDTPKTVETNPDTPKTAETNPDTPKTAETNIDTSKTDETPDTIESGDYKRKLTDETADESVVKKPKLDGKHCTRPRGVKRVYKGATFWPSNLRQKLCTCNECISMYKDLAVLFLIDPEDTVNAYEALGKEISEGPSSQYEKGLQALSSLDRVQQINALTEYNKMRDKLLDFLKGYKDRKEIVKEEDIKSFFAGMKPKREPDGVYFCR